MHSGLLQPDNAPAPGYFEARQVKEELDASPEISNGLSMWLFILIMMLMLHGTYSPRGRS